jgi:hypothetical protein
LRICLLSRTCAGLSCRKSEADAGPILESSRRSESSTCDDGWLEPDSYSGTILDCEAQHAGWTHIVSLLRGVDSFMIGFVFLPEPAAGLVPSGWSGSAIVEDSISQALL